MPLADTLRSAAEMLASVSDTPRLDAELLIAHALGLSRSDMLMKQRDLAVPQAFAALLDRRLAHEPVAYITGHQDFWDITLEVSPAVLIPRADSETLIEAARLKFADVPPPQRILDLGTGSGALLLAALSCFPLARGIGIDASAAALEIAALNAGKLGMAGRASFLNVDWRKTGWLERAGTDHHLILCNPPYVEADAILSPMVAGYEPHSALFAGPEGLDDYRILIPAMPALLAPGGVAIFEIGATQAEAVSDLAIACGLRSTLKHDLAGKPRALVLDTPD